MHPGASHLPLLLPLCSCMVGGGGVFPNPGVLCFCVLSVWRYRLGTVCVVSEGCILDNPSMKYMHAYLSFHQWNWFDLKTLEAVSHAAEYQKLSQDQAIFMNNSHGINQPYTQTYPSFSGRNNIMTVDSVYELNKQQQNVASGLQLASSVSFMSESSSWRQCIVSDFGKQTNEQIMCSLWG